MPVTVVLRVYPDTLLKDTGELATAVCPCNDLGQQGNDFLRSEREILLPCGTRG